MSQRYDTIVIGSGLAGSITATILARCGFRVLLLEKGQHPRMAIGESLLPPTALWFWILGQKYDIPEITNLAHLDSISEHIAPSSGVKRGFGFVYHRDGQPYNPDEANLLLAPQLAYMREGQFYRQDIDHYMVKTAQNYGVDYHDLTTIEDVEIDSSGVRVIVQGGQVYEGRFVVDGSGYKSVLADKFGLRENPSRLKHHSRTIFTHMRNLRPLEQAVPETDMPNMSDKWSRTTLHHVFDGGWFWIIPFNNYHNSKSDLVSVGVTVDPRKHPKPDDMTPEQEFWQFVNRFPTVAKHFDGAQAARDYTGTGRIQYSSTRSTGERFLLLNHSYGFIDPLYSRGLWRSVETIAEAVERLIPALREDDFSPERFAYLDTMQEAMLNQTDQLVYNSFRSMVDYSTWAAYMKVWMADELMLFLPVLSATLRYMQTGNISEIDTIKGAPRPGMAAPYAADLQNLMDVAEGLLDQVDAQTLTAEAAAQGIYDKMAASDWLPPTVWGWDKAGDHHFDLTPPHLMKLLFWGNVLAPKPIRQQVFNFSVPALLGMQAKAALMPKSLRRDIYGNIIPKASARDTVTVESVPEPKLA